jgi:DNA invertase Pin-like site-specific DNA recombinase
MSKGGIISAINLPSCFVEAGSCLRVGLLTTASPSSDGINLLADWCDRGVRVVSVTQQIDLSGPVGRMVASVMFGLAEIELEYRRERQQAGIAVAKSRGVYRGRKKGTTKSKPTRARQLRKQGLTTPEIANALAVSERTVFRYLG